MEALSRDAEQRRGDPGPGAIPEFSKLSLDEIRGVKPEG
jgi:hypothetical protein